MATVVSPIGSFVQFNNMNFEHCVFGTVKRTLPVYSDDDVAFQFVVRGTEEEADALSTLSSTAVTVGLVSNATELFYPTLIEFTDETPERFRISDTEVLFNWTAGFPGFKDVVSVGDCFKVQVTVSLDDVQDVFISNDFERIGDDCFTSVIEYGNDDNAFGFNYCGTGTVDTGGGGEEPPTEPPTACEPTRITFTNQATLEIPYTAGMQALYGSLPTVQAWIYDEAGDLINAGFSIKLDASPPTVITADFGGVASGYLIIK